MAVLAMTLAVALFILGLIGTVLPVLPGAILIFGGMLLYGFLTGFVTLDSTFFLLQSLALILVFAVDYVAVSLGTRRVGGSRYAAWGAAAGMLLGIFILGPFGVIAGPFIGAVAAEAMFGRNKGAAVKVGFGTLLGLLGGTVLKLLIEGMMIAAFFLAVMR